jgi:hypothetical protein
VLRDRFHARAPRTPREVCNALACVLLDARRRPAERIGVSAPASRCARRDPAASSRCFDGWRNLDGSAGTGPPPVAPPHTGLPRIGWCRHGLCDPLEVPGSRERTHR